MNGIILTKEIQIQFEERIKFLKYRIDVLNQEFNDSKLPIKSSTNIFRTSENLKIINSDWKIQMICHKNELSFREDILKDAIIN